MQINRATLQGIQKCCYALTKVACSRSCHAKTVHIVSIHFLLNFLVVFYLDLEHTSKINFRRRPACKGLTLRLFS